MKKQKLKGTSKHADAQKDDTETKACKGPCHSINPRGLTETSRKCSQAARPGFEHSLAAARSQGCTSADFRRPLWKQELKETSKQTDAQKNDAKTKARRGTLGAN